MTIAPVAACCWLDVKFFPSPSCGIAVRNAATYIIEIVWRVIPMPRERLRPITSTRKKAHRIAATNLTTPKIAVAKSFS